MRNFIKSYIRRHKKIKSKNRITNEFLIIPYQGHYVLYIKGELEGHYDTQEEALTALKNKGYNYY